MPPRVVESYEYVDETGQHLYTVERLVPKGFRQWRPGNNGDKAYGLGDTRRVLYRLPEVLAAVAAGKWIVVVEGEKDAESMRAKGATATTPPGGAGKWRTEYTEVFRDAKVMIISDADDTGRKHALTVACALDPVVKELRIFEPAHPHKDITAHLGAGLGRPDLVPFERGVVQVDLNIQDKDGRKRAGVITAMSFCRRPGPDGSGQVLGPMLWRSMRCTVGAASGDGKTTVGCQMVRAVVCAEPFLDWRGTGGRALIVDVEQGEETVKQRLRDVGLDDNPNVDLLWEPDGLALDREPKDRAYVEKALADGKYDVALFDPLYQLHQGDQNSERTAADVMRILDEWARRFKLAVVIPMHRRKPHPQAGQRFTMNEIGGNSAWVRNSEVVLGLQVMHPGRSRLHFFKDRPGFLPGIGTSWMLKFDPRTHTFSRTDEPESGAGQTREMLKTTPGLTTAEYAEAFSVKPGTIKKHMDKIGAHPHPDDSTLALDERRWSLEPWMPNQMTFDGAETA